ncbi:MAG TPA: VCBS repeat-containing protein, partial [Acidimicrobiia bacterium]|nr:VCBS repeat-containing protein [Acidimicrobiia bacterium]
MRACSGSFPAAAVLFALIAGLVPASPATPAPVPGDDDRVQAAIPVPAVRPGFPLLGGGTPYSVGPTIVDLDADGFPEIIGLDDNGRFHVVNRFGDPFGGFTVDIGGVPSGPPAVGDVDYDGFVEIVTVAKNGKVRIFSNEGALEGFPIASLPAAPVGGPVLTEIDRSGKLAIVVATVNGQLHVLLPEGGYAPGFPVSGGVEARSGAFVYIGPDNFPRLGFLGGSPSRARIFFTYAQPDTQASVTPGFEFGPAAAVAGARPIFGLNDADHLYLMGRQGGLRRLTPDPGVNTVSMTVLAGLPNDSVLVQPSLLDVTGDLVPELGVMALRGDTLGIWLLDGESGLPLAGFPRRYLQAAAVGGIVCADVG